VLAFKQAAAAAGFPVFMWFWDPIDYGQERRRWFEEVAPLFDLVFLNEKGREAMWACQAAAARVHYIEEGAMVEGDRGPGRRPVAMPEPASGADVSFQGTVYPFPPDYARVRVIMALAAVEQFDLAVYGPEDMWRQLNITSRGMSYGVQSSHIHAASKVSLSLSREQPDVELYRSERLIDGAASGACVLSETFPGLDLLLPVDSILTADSPEQYVKEVAAVIRDPRACDIRRRRAAAAAWRYHTWDDSIAKFLALVGTLLPRNASPTALPRASPDGDVLACSVFCRQGQPGRSRAARVGNARVASPACEPLCDQGNYNWRVGALLMGWRIEEAEGGVDASNGGQVHGRRELAPPPAAVGGAAAVPGTAVEAGIYFWAAIRECPEACAAWEGLAVALLVRGASFRENGPGWGEGGGNKGGGEGRA